MSLRLGFCFRRGMEFGNVMLFVDCFLIVMMLDLELIFFDLRKAYLFIRVSGVGMKFG